MKVIPLKQLFSWLLGMIILLIVTNIVLNKLQFNMQTQYDPTAYYWAKFILYLLIGAYAALILSKLNIQKSNLVAGLALLIGLIFIGIALLQPLMTMIDSFPSFIYNLVSLSMNSWFAIIGGFLFILGFFLFNSSAKTYKTQ